MLLKSKRIENRELLDSYHSKPCEVCGTRQGTVAHHIKTKNSGGPDEDWNLLAICHVHHTEIHKRGAAFMCQKYFHLEKIFHKKGWLFDEIGKLRRK